MSANLPADMIARRLTSGQFDPTSVGPFDKMYERYRLTPAAVFGKSLITFQFSLTANVPQRLIGGTVAKFYLIIPGDNAVDVLIGGPNVTPQSGFRLPSDSAFPFALVENAELFAVSTSNTTVHVLDMGL